MLTFFFFLIPGGQYLILEFVVFVTDPASLLTAKNQKNKKKLPRFVTFYFVHNVMLCGSTISLLCKKKKKVLMCIMFNII